MAAYKSPPYHPCPSSPFPPTVAGILAAPAYSGYRLPATSHRRLSIIKNNLTIFPDPLGFHIDDQGLHFGLPNP